MGLPKWEFSTGKKHFMLGKKSGKMILPPQKNMPVTPLCPAMVICAVHAKKSIGTITHPPYVIIKMAATAIALHSGQKETMILPFNFHALNNYV